jgi:hypothetical protein
LGRQRVTRAVLAEARPRAHCARDAGFQNVPADAHPCLPWHSGHKWPTISSACSTWRTSTQASSVARRRRRHIWHFIVVAILRSFSIPGRSYSPSAEPGRAESILVRVIALALAYAEFFGPGRVF